jgi:hypothetical protein
MIEQLQLTSVRRVIWSSLIGEFQLLQSTVGEGKQAVRLVLDSRTSEMIVRIFEAMEAMCRAIIILLIVEMGVAVTCLGAAILSLLAYRIWQLVWTLILKEPWI